MLVVMWLAGILAAGIHVLIFCMESLWWTTPAVRARFRQTPEQAQATRLFAFNQGFYNLFLALGVFAGLVLVLAGHPVVGLTLAAWSCLSMLGAAVVLLASAPGMQRGALIQGVAPLLFLLLGLLMGCAPGRTQTGDAPPAVGSVTEQESHTTALLQAVSAVDDSVIWVSGHRATWVRTVDGGRTWVAGAMTGRDSTLQFRDVAAVSATTAYLLAAGPGEQSRIYKTTDAGQSWRLQFQNRDSAAFYDCFDFWDPTHGIAVSDAAHGKMIVIRTEDGEHWSAVAEDGMPAAVPQEGSPAAGGTCLIVGGRARAWFGTLPVARVYRSSDRGLHWSIATPPIVSGEAAGVATLAFRDERHGMALGGRLLKPDDRTDSVAAVTDDAGATWTRVSRPTFPGAVYGAAVVPNLRGFVVVAGPKGLDWTGNDGRLWTNLSNAAYWAVGCTVHDACWAAGPGGRITRVTFGPP